MSAQFVVPNREKVEYVIGIDFGHGETSAAYCRINDTRDPIDIDLTGFGRKTIPSVLYIDNDDIFIGEESVELYGEGEGKGGQFYAYFKHSLETLDEEKDPSVKIMKLYMQKVYNLICDRLANVVKDGDSIKDNHVVFIACPSQSQQWDDNAMKNYVQLAVEAGLPIAGAVIDDQFKLSGIVRESRAAYLRFMQQNDELIIQSAKEGILVIDFGSSTIDITYYKEGEKPIDKGYPCGAQAVEKNIYRYLEVNHPELKNGTQNPEFLHNIRRQFPHIAIDCLYQIRRSKENYYQKGMNAHRLQFSYESIRMPDSFINVYIPKDILNNEILNDYKSQVERAFGDFKENFIQNNKVTLLVLTGGASRMDFVHDMAKNIFECVKTLPPQDSSLTVSNGIATAGRADVKLYYMLQDLLADDRVVSPNIFEAVLEDAASSMAKEIISDMDDSYRSFKNQSYNGSIVSLKDSISNKIMSNSSIYKTCIQTSYNKVLRHYVDKTFIEVIKEYIKKYFPYFNLSQISPREIENVSIKISDASKDILNKITTDSIEKIEDNVIVGTVKLLYNIASLLEAALAKLGFEAIAGLKNFGSKVWDKINGNYHNPRNDWHAPTYESILNELVVNFKDENTKLDSEERQKVYEEFCTNKSKYNSSLEIDIRIQLRHNSDFKQKVVDTTKDTILSYLLKEIIDIQLLIK